MDNTIKTQEFDVNKRSLVINPRQQFTENVQKWVLLDTQLKIINEKTRKIRETKNELSDVICEYMNKNNLLQNKIGISDGELRVYQKKEYSALSYGYIDRCLAELITDKKQLNYIIEYLKDNREVTNSLDIKRTYNKKE